MHYGEDFYNAADWLIDRNVREGRGDKIAVYSQHKNLTYKELQTMINKTGNLLKKMGIGIDDRVMMLVLDIPMFLGVFYGAIKIGANPIPINTMMMPDDYKYYLNDSRAKVLFISDALVPQIEAIKEDLLYLRDVVVINEVTGLDLPYNHLYNMASENLECAYTTADDNCFWLYSSGSTGAPKGVIHAHKDMETVAVNYARGVLGMKESDITLSAARLFFAYGLGNAGYFAFSVGGSTILHSAAPKPEGMYDLFKKFKPTVYFGVPTLYGAMLALQEQRDKEAGLKNPGPSDAHACGSLRLCVSAGEALPAELYNRWKARYGIDILDGIGSTELLHIYISNRPDDIRPGASGKATPHYELKIVNDEGKEAEVDEPGTMMVRCDSAAMLYWKKRAKTRATMQGEWLNTGDKYYRDKDGYYFCAGRGDDMLKVGGIWVSPVEVEACLIEHPAVLEAAVTGKEDEEKLVKPKAWVVLKQGQKPSEALAKELQRWCLDKMAKYKYPRWIEFVEALPKTPTGKIQRFKLRAK
ncbi:MAG: Benzoate--CoA ligase [Smithella sp. PtaU1.Bin162]|nr:MAG: Benzoate--CoA ligase [Smithella sp. PtaU1.Bin162]